MCIRDRLYTFFENAEIIFGVSGEKILRDVQPLSLIHILYILDEPLSGIDPAARDSILDIILGNYSENATVMLSTHLVYDVERIFDDVIIMSYGQLLVACLLYTSRCV